MAKYNFDGLDLDFEFPEGQDKASFATWVQELKASFGSQYEVAYNFYRNYSVLQSRNLSLLDSSPLQFRLLDGESTTDLTWLS